MTTTTGTTASDTATSSRGSRHQLTSGLDALNGQIGGLLDLPVWSLSDTELDGSIQVCSAELARLTTLRLALVREAHGRDLATRAGATSTAALLRERLRICPMQAHRLVALAVDVDGPLAATGTALALGAINAEQAWAVRETVHSLPRGAGADVAHAAEACLLTLSETFDPTELRRLGRRIREQLTTPDPSPGPPDPANRDRPGDHDGAGKSGGSDGEGDGGDGDGPGSPATAGGPDADGAARGRAETGDPADRRGLWISDLPGGTTRLTADLDAEAAALLRCALDPLAAPLPAEDGLPDTRRPARRRADALVDLVHRALDAAALPATGGVRPHLTVTVPWGTLVGGGGTPAVTSWGRSLPRGVLKRLVCDASVSRVVLDPASVPLDVGRAHRTVPADLRRALVARDRCCAHPGCDRPPSWCQAHHIRSWADGGTTCLDNLVLLCGFHHRVVHHHGWTIRLGPDRRPTFIPPTWADADQKPRTNPYSRTLVDRVDLATRDQAGPSGSSRKLITQDRERLAGEARITR